MWYNGSTNNVVLGSAVNTPSRIHLIGDVPMNTVPHHDLNFNFTIYALIDPRDYAVCYIGITDDVYRRFFQHLSCDGDNPAKDAWITQLRLDNVMLIMKTLEVVPTVEQAREREAFWIQHYKFLGTPLLNQLIPSIRLPKRMTQPALIKVRRERDMSNVGRKGSNHRVKETIIYYHVHKEWPKDCSQDMGRYYKRLYFTVPYTGEKSYRGKGYESHKRIYDRGQQWIKAYESAQEGA